MLVSRWFLALCCVFASAVPALSEAWGREGHAVIADIASQYMTPAALAEVSVLLQDDRDASGAPSGATRLAQIASWADDWRRTSAGKATTNWHFEDQPVCGTAPIERICPDGVCIGTELPREIAILGDRSRSALERNQALKWVVHLVGDAHQPLHASNNNDRGGNDVPVVFLGQAHLSGYPVNLHGVWDTYLVEILLKEAHGEANFAQISIPLAERTEWARAAPEQWLQESLVMAQQSIYPHLGSAYVCGQPPSSSIVLGVDYYVWAAPLVRLRLQQAGIRLAQVLNTTLGQP